MLGAVNKSDLITEILGAEFIMFDKEKLEGVGPSKVQAKKAFPNSH